MESYFNNKSIFLIFNKWKYHIVIILVIAAFGSGASSYLLKEKFKSVAVVYPVNLGAYSEESPTEQMQQLLMSQDIKDSVINYFGLGSIYRVDSSSAQRRSTIYSIYEKNISIRRTEFESIEIVVLDEKPQRACDIANFIVNFYNRKVARMHRLKHNEVLQIKTKELVRRQNEINEINEQLKVLGSKYGLTHYDIQLEELTKGYIKLISSGKESSKALADIKEILENFKVKGSELKELSAKFGGSLSSYLELRKEYDKALEEAEKQITYAQIVSAPYPADKKSFPVRWVIMALSVVAVLFFTIIVIGVIESRNK